MKTIILLDQNKRDREFLTIEWEAKFDISIIEVSSIVEAIRSIESLEKNRLPILVIKGAFEDTESLLKNYLKNCRDAFLLTDNEQFLQDIEKESDAITKIKLDSFFKIEEVALSFEKCAVEKCGKEDSEYFKIKFFNFLQFNCTVTDIFLKLGKGNYVKIIHAGELFTKEILQKYQKKEIKYLYIHKDDFPKFMDEVAKTLLVFYEKDSLTDNILKEVQVASLENINHSLKTVGLSKSTVDLANQTILSVIESFKGMNRLWDYLLNKADKGTFLTEHSLYVSVLACAISDGLEWKTDYTLKKVVMASLLHDISIENCHLAYLRGNIDDAFSELTSNEQELYLNHPQDACKLLKDFPELPSNVDSIILEHHERPNGEGFPRKLNSFNITPLSCVLIIAEEFYHLLYQNGFTVESRNMALKELGKYFSQGNFKSPLNSLVNLFIKGGEL